jgi:streptomycin 6-kinase
MTRFPIPPYLEQAARADQGGRLRDWVTALPEIVDQLSDRWSLALGSPYRHGGSAAWVAPARGPSGEELVLKVGWRHGEALHEPVALRLWNGAGAVRLHAGCELEATIAMLIERCVPGSTLAQDEPPHVQDEVVARLLRRLWVRPPDGHGFQSLAEMCEGWAAEAELGLGRVAGGPDAGRAPAGPDAGRAPAAHDAGLVRAGLELLRELPRDAPSPVVLVTDVHAGNVLAAEPEPWLAIDPKPYVGDRAYDPVQHMLNCRDRLERDPAGLARRMADLTGCDRVRVTSWLFARCAQESIADPELASVAARLAPA